MAAPHDLDPDFALCVLLRTCHIALGHEPLEATLQRVSELAAEMLAVEETSLTLIRRGTPTTVGSCGDLARALDQCQYEQGAGPCLDAASTGVRQEITDASTEQRWPDFLNAARQLGLGSSLSMPIRLPGAVAAVLNLYSRRPQAFEGAVREQAREFAAFAGTMLALIDRNDSWRREAEHLRIAMGSRAAIEQAKGILMGARRCDEDAAFHLLVAASQRSNRKLHDVAQALVDAVTKATSDESLERNEPIRRESRHSLSHPQSARP